MAEFNINSALSFLTSTDAFEVTFGIFGAVLIVYAAVSSWTTFAALSQMGSIQERTASWSSLTKPISKASESLGATLLSPLLSDKSKHPERQEINADQAVDSIKAQDKITYTLSAINLMLTGFIAGAVPHFFYLWHLPKMFFYVSHRWYTFSQTGHHYLLFDFCYWCVGLQALYVVFFPQNQMLFQVTMQLSNAPLAWAVISFGQSLILHSIPHMTSVFIHVSPMILSFCIRWYPSDRFKVCDDWPECKTVDTWRDLIVAPMKFYLSWVVIYYVFIYFIMDSRIKDRGYKTLFDRIISKGPTRHIAKLSKSEIVQKTIYMMTHVLFATSTMLLAISYFRNQYVNFLFMFMVLSASAWNASNFYFTVFINNYREEAERRAGIEAAAVEENKKKAITGGAKNFDDSKPSEKKKHK